MPATPQALGLLLDLLEAKSLRYTHAALTDFHGRDGDDLIASGLVAPVGFEKVVAAADDDDGRPVLLDVHDQTGGLGYNSPSQGRVQVDQLETAAYSARPDLLAKQLLDRHLFPPPVGVKSLDEGNFIWDLGAIRLNAAKFVPAWLVRRLGDRAVIDILRAENAARPSIGGRLILTSTPRDRTPTLQMPGLMIVSISDVLETMAPTRIDIGTLTRRYAGAPADRIEFPLHLSSDNRVMVINGTIRIEFKGKKQRAVARLIVDAHKSGQAIRAADVLAKADSGATSFDQAFSEKQWNVLKGYFTSRGDSFWTFQF